MGPANNGTVDVSLSIRSHTDSRKGREIELAVTDRPSGQRIVDVILNAEDLVGLLSGQYLSDREAWVVPDLLRYRLGLKMENQAIPVPDELVDRYVHPTDWMDRSIQWAEDVVRDSDWADYDEPRRNNKGQIIVVFRRWVKP